MTHLLPQLQTLLPALRNTPLAWLRGIIAGIVLLGISIVARRVARHYNRRFEAAGHTDLTALVFEVASHTTTFFLLVMAVFIGLMFVRESPRAHAMIDDAVTVVIFWQVGVWGSTAAGTWLEGNRRARHAGDRAAESSLGVLIFIARAAVWVIVVLLALENLGVNITTLVAGLGVGGVAVALAVQNILGDLFASLSITFDQPFFVGDSVTVDTFQGTVEHIGIKSTRLRSISGEQIVLANADLLKSRLRNYGRMTERRVLFTLGVTYETPVELLERIPRILRGIIEKLADTRFDRSHFVNHGASSLDFETVYHVTTADYARHMDIQQELQLQIHREFTRLGVEFAYPTQRLLLERASPPPPSPQPP